MYFWSDTVVALIKIVTVLINVIKTLFYVSH